MVQWIELIPSWLDRSKEIDLFLKKHDERMKKIAENEEMLSCDIVQQRLNEVAVVMNKSKEE